MTQQKNFLPRTKPRSWTVSCVSVLIALVGGLAAAFAGDLLNGIIGTVCSAISIGASITTLLSAMYFAFGLLTGKYKNLKEVAWKDQVW